MDTITVWSFDTLPDEILIHIVIYAIRTDVRDIQAFALNKRIYALASAQWPSIVYPTLTTHPSTISIESIIDLIQCNIKHKECTVLCTTTSYYSIFLYTNDHVPRTQSNAILEISLSYDRMLYISTRGYSIAFMSNGSEYTINRCAYRKVLDVNTVQYTHDINVHAWESNKLTINIGYLLQKLFPDIAALTNI